MKKLFGCFIALSFLLISLNLATPVNAAVAPVNVTYQAYVQNTGWQKPVLGGVTAGTIARSLRLEALKISLVNAPAGATVTYAVHILNVGWQTFKSNGTLAGITGRGYSIDAVRITLGNMPGYSIEYQSYIRNVGWQTLKYNGEISGTVNRGYRVDAFRVRIVKVSDNTTFSLSYASHIRGVGWQTPVFNGQLSGTEGRGYRIDAFRISLANAPAGARVKYQSHVSGLGWLAPVYTGGQSGIIAKSYGIEAVKISLENMPGCSIQYRVRNGLGVWTPWVSNGAVAGPVTGTLQMEAIEIRIVSNPITMILPTSVSLNKTTDTLNVGTTDTLIPSILPVNASVKNVLWVSSNPSVATVSTTGVVTAIKAGTASITATTIWGSVSSTCLVTVVVPVSSITVSGTGGATGISVHNGTLQMLATVLPTNATNKDVTWSLSGTGVATISTTGLLSAVDNGTVTVMATSVSTGSVVGSLLVTISNQPVTPAAPSVTNNDVLNTVTGMTTAMEYKLDAAAYVLYNATTFNALNLSGNHTLLVRVAAEGINPVSADTTLVFTASAADLAEVAVSAYETAPITTLLQISDAEALKTPADTAVALVSDSTQRTAFELRISNRTTTIASAKAALLLAQAIAAINDAPDATAMGVAITNNASILGLNLTGYNALSDIGKANVQGYLLAMPFTTSAQIKSVFDSGVVQQTALMAVNTATTSTMGSVLSTYASTLGLSSAIQADYNLLTTVSKDAVHLALYNKAFATIADVNSTYNNNVSVLIINEITVDSTMQAAILRYQTILGLSLTDYNALTSAFKINVRTALINALMTTPAEVKTVFDNAVAQAKIDYAVYVINIQVFNFMDRDIRTYAATLGLDLTDYNTLINKTPLLTAMVAEPFTTAAHVKEFFDALVLYQKILESKPMFEAFNDAPDAATMANVIGIYSTIFNPTDYNVYENYIGASAKTAIQTAMLTPVYVTQRDIEMAFLIGIMNNPYVNYGKLVFNNNYVFFGLSTSTLSNEFAALGTTERNIIVNAVFATRPIVDQAQILLAVFNNVTTTNYIGTLIDLNSTTLGLDLTLYNTIADKTPVFNALIGKAFASIADLKAAFNAEVAILTTVDATLVSPKEYNLDTPADVTSQVTLNSAKDITGISEVYNAYTLIKTTDYTFDAFTGTLTITQVGLAKLAFVPGDTLLFNVSFDVGNVAQLVVNVTGTTVTSAYVDSPKLFNVITPAPISTLVTLNSAHAITGIDNNGVPLANPADYTFNATTGELVIAQAYIESLNANPGDVIILNITFDVGFAGGLNINVINNDITAVGSATIVANTNIITYTLTTGTFDPITAIEPANWTISGIAAADLGSISNIVLSNGDTTATITVTGTAIQYTVDYIIEPAQAAFPAGVISSSYSYITVLDPYAIATATATTGTNTITISLTIGKFDPSWATNPSYWYLGGADAVDLGDVTSASVAYGNRSATLTISGTVGPDTQAYTVTADQIMFTNMGYTAPATQPVSIIADTLIIADAYGMAQTQTIVVNLSIGTFDPIAALDPTNWVLGGIAPGELGAVSEVVLSNGDATATLTVAGGTSPTLIQFTTEYTVAPAQAAFSAGFAAPAPITIIVYDPYAAGNATAVTGTQTITYNLTVGAIDPAEAVFSSNWVLDGADVADLGTITDIVLSNADMTVTLTISGTVGDNTKIYTIAPQQMAFTNVGYSAPALPASIIVTP
jgi:uncharacterized protein YjdB